MAKEVKLGAAGATAFRTAELLIERHGAAALDFAQSQMRQLADKGAGDAAADWRQVVEAIESLLRQAPKR